MHEQTDAQLTTSTKKYKLQPDWKCQFVDFVVGDFVYAILTNDHSLVHEYNKLVARKIGPSEIIEKINQNAYHLQFSSHIHVVHVFNVKHLIPYFGDVFFFFCIFLR